MTKEQKQDTVNIALKQVIEIERKMGLIYKYITTLMENVLYAALVLQFVKYKAMINSCDNKHTTSQCL